MASSYPREEASTDTTLYGIDTILGEGVYKVMYDFCVSKEMAAKLAKKIASEFCEKNHTLIDYNDDDDALVSENCRVSCYMGEEIRTDEFLDAFRESIKGIVYNLEGAGIDEKLNKLFSSRNKESLDEFLESVVLDSR